MLSNDYRNLHTGIVTAHGDPRAIVVTGQDHGCLAGPIDNDASHPACEIERPSLVIRENEPFGFGGSRRERRTLPGGDPDDALARTERAGSFTARILPRMVFQLEMRKSNTIAHKRRAIWQRCCRRRPSFPQATRQ